MIDEKLKTFLAVVRCGNLTRAARDLYISQPAVTLQIHKLEKECGEILFYRRERGMELTDAGKILYEYACKMDQLEQEAAESLGTLSGELRGTLRVGATLTIGEYLLPKIIGNFKAKNPCVEILLEVENTRRIVDLVASGIMDCGLVEGPFENGQIRSEKLTDDELIFIGSPQNRLSGLTGVSLETVMQEPYILREPGSGTRLVFENALKRAGINPDELEILMQLGSTQAIKALVAENLGISVLSKRTVQKEIQENRLVPLDVPSLDLHRAFEFIFQKGTRLSLITRQFIQTCRSFIHERNTA